MSFLWMRRKMEKERLNVFGEGKHLFCGREENEEGKGNFFWKSDKEEEITILTILALCFDNLKQYQNVGNKIFDQLINDLMQASNQSNNNLKTEQRTKEQSMNKEKTNWK